jgi:glycosyltransferase involved in cell wall biosynthesis
MQTMKTNEYLFSVIVPIYNVEKYLHKTIESVLQQSCGDFELILVDDGSKDSCGVICDDYREKDDRIKVIHKPNGGIVSARKAGVEIASGRYCVCLDGDDWLHTDTLLKISNVIKEYNSPDVICFNMVESDEQNEELSRSRSRVGYYSRTDIENEVFPMLIQKEDASYFAPSLCGKAIETELYKQQQQQQVAPGIMIGEDGACSIPCVYRASSLYVMEDYLYYYRKNLQSVTKSKRVLSWNIPVINANHLKKTIDMTQYDFQEQLYRKVIHDIYIVLGSQFNQEAGFFQIRKDIVEHLQEPTIKEAIRKAKFRKSAKAFVLIWTLRLKVFLPYKIMMR